MALALTTAIYIPTVAQQTAQATCGVWRWPVKTLSDPARTKVDFNPINVPVKYGAMDREDRKQRGRSTYRKPGVYRGPSRRS